MTEHDECPEPDGQRVTADGRSAHEVFLAETGQCPWCGREEDDNG